MKLLLLAIFLFVGINSQAQSIEHKKLNCEVLIDYDYSGDVNIYDISGKLITKMQNKDKGDDLVFITIIGKNDSMYHVIANHAFENDSTNGWMKKSNPHISIYSKTCGSDPTLNLYAKPDKNSKILSTIKEHTDYLHVKDCENNWLWVSIITSGKKYEGWISPDMQCHNPYSTCCGN